MTPDLRDQFAMSALVLMNDKPDETASTLEVKAIVAYQMADAMLAAREIPVDILKGILV